MKNRIYINSDIFINLLKLIVSKLLVVANSGGGKSWLIRRIVEQAFGKVQIIIIDPEGEFSTLREKYDFILCGKGMDAPAETRSAAMLAHKLLETKTSAVIDLYELHPQDRKRFVRLFFEAMVNAPKNLYNDCLIVLDEAHRFAPENGESEALSAVIEMASLGRKRGLLVLATQRISKLSKDAAAECNNKLIGRTSLDIDRKRAADELGILKKEDVLALRNLAPGEFFAFGPAISNEVIKLKVGVVKTSIPKAGRQTKVLPPSEKIKKELAALANLPQEAEREARTTKELQDEVRSLKTQLRQVPKPIMDSGALKRACDETAKNAAIVHRKEIQRVEKGWYDYVTQYLEPIISKLAVQFSEKSLDVLFAHRPKQYEAPKEESPRTFALAQKSMPTIIRPSTSDFPFKSPSQEDVSSMFPRDIGKGERKILIAIAQHETITREHLTVLTSYKKSSRDTYLQRLQSRGLVQINNGRIEATEAGKELLGSDYKPLPTGDVLREHVLADLPEGESKILAILIDSHPDAVERDYLSEMMPYKKSSRDTYLQRLTARQLVTQEGRGLVRASDNLFE